VLVDVTPVGKASAVTQRRPKTQVICTCLLPVYHLCISLQHFFMLLFVAALISLTLLVGFVKSHALAF